MEYRAVGNRCGVVLGSLELPISNEETIQVLFKKGFRVVDVDLVSLARKQIGVSKYRLGAKLSEAPNLVDCSSFVKWLYGQKGIWLPRRSIQQRELGEIIDVDDILTGDVIFKSGRINYFFDDPNKGVGHVGIVTEKRTVIHAANQKLNVIESSLESFVREDKFRGIRRYIPQSAKVCTLEVPLHIEIESSDDLRWIVLKFLSK